MKYLILIISVFVIFTGCGVVLDPLRIEGTWTLSQVQFYAANNALDSIKTYNGVDADTPTSDSPIISEFFGDTIRSFNNATAPAEVDVAKAFKYTITFIDDNTFELDINYTQTKSDGTNATGFPSTNALTARVYGSWAISQFDNSLLMKIGANDDQKFGNSLYLYWRTNFFWDGGITIRDSWPMVDYNTLNLTVKASDFYKSYFTVNLSGKILKVASMVGTFKK
jgi:hypothetical protein